MGIRDKVRRGVIAGVNAAFAPDPPTSGDTTEVVVRLTVAASRERTAEIIESKASEFSAMLPALGGFLGVHATGIEVSLG